MYPWFREKHGEQNHLKSPKAKGKKDSEAGETVKTPPLSSQPSNSILPVGLVPYSQASNQRGVGLTHLLRSRRGGNKESTSMHRSKRLSTFPTWYQPLKSVQTIRSLFIPYPPHCIRGEYTHRDRHISAHMHTHTHPLVIYIYALYFLVCVLTNQRMLNNFKLKILYNSRNPPASALS